MKVTILNVRALFKLYSILRHFKEVYLLLFNPPIIFEYLRQNSDENDIHCCQSIVLFIFANILS